MKFLIMLAFGAVYVWIIAIPLALQLRTTGWAPIECTINTNSAATLQNKAKFDKIDGGDGFELAANNFRTRGDFTEFGIEYYCGRQQTNVPNRTTVANVRMIYMLQELATYAPGNTITAYQAPNDPSTTALFAGINRSAITLPEKVLIASPILIFFVLLPAFSLLKNRWR